MEACVQISYFFPAHHSNISRRSPCSRIDPLSLGFCFPVEARSKTIRMICPLWSKQLSPSKYFHKFKLLAHCRVLVRENINQISECPAYSMRLMPPMTGTPMCLEVCSPFRHLAMNMPIFFRAKKVVSHKFRLHQRRNDPLALLLRPALHGQGQDFTGMEERIRRMLIARRCITCKKALSSSSFGNLVESLPLKSFISSSVPRSCFVTA